VARVLQLIGTVPNRRNAPQAADLEGDYDFGFDGGAGRIVTGYTEFFLLDGTRAIVGCTLGLSLDIRFCDGRMVRGQQMFRHS
jgi:hypothetical protein